MASLAHNQDDPLMRVYPGLRAQPWHDPGGFPIVQALQDAYPEIRDEILAMDPGAFHKETESIRRTGSWDVLLLYPRGRKDEEVCARLPVTSQIIEQHRTVRTHAGLMYVSRLSPGSRVMPHHGPTNVRLRCHLGIQVPAGDCGIRAGGEARQWQQGKCLVFDDYFLHEAWNNTAEPRIVLILDIWHPDLSDEEVELLTGLHRHASATGANLQRYWANNAKARGAGNKEYD
ncbi:MAG TPA: aspartyl/asparaginyl beta-hydroxylase domain-containing protein [Chloroflexota bacterium]